MPRRRLARLAAAMITVAAVSPALGTATAQANSACPYTRTVCVFAQHNYGGNPQPISVPGYHSAWLRFTAVASFNPLSLIDNSGSDIWVYQDGSGEECIHADGSQSFPNGYIPDWFFIQYNVNTCPFPPVPP